MDGKVSQFPVGRNNLFTCQLSKDKLYVNNKREMEVPQSPFHYERVEIHQINFRGPVAEQQGVGEDSQAHTGRHFEMTITKSEVLY